MLGSHTWLHCQTVKLICFRLSLYASCYPLSMQVASAMLGFSRFLSVPVLVSVFLMPGLCVTIAHRLYILQLYHCDMFVWFSWLGIFFDFMIIIEGLYFLDSECFKVYTQHSGPDRQTSVDEASKRQCKTETNSLHTTCQWWCFNKHFTASIPK